jgi:hypothetical protein
MAGPRVRLIWSPDVVPEKAVTDGEADYGAEEHLFEGWWRE